MTRRTRIVLTVVIAALLLLYLIPFSVLGIGGWWSLGAAIVSIAALVAIWLPRHPRTHS